MYRSQNIMLYTGSILYTTVYLNLKQCYLGGYSGGPVVKTSPFQGRECGLHSWSGSQDPTYLVARKKKSPPPSLKKHKYYSKFNKIDPIKLLYSTGSSAEASVMT